MCFSVIRIFTTFSDITKFFSILFGFLCRDFVSTVVIVVVVVDRMSLKGKLKRRSYSLKAEIKTQVRPHTVQMGTGESEHF